MYSIQDLPDWNGINEECSLSHWAQHCFRLFFCITSTKTFVHHTLTFRSLQIASGSWHKIAVHSDCTRSRFRTDHTPPDRLNRCMIIFKGNIIGETTWHTMLLYGNQLSSKSPSSMTDFLISEWYVWGNLRGNFWFVIRPWQYGTQRVGFATEIQWLST